MGASRGGKIDRGGKMKLSDKTCKTAKPKEKPYKLFDGNGLFLEVLPTGKKLWRLKYRHLGKESRISFGSAGYAPPSAR